MSMKYSVVITTCENKEDAKKIAEALIEERLAACVHMFPVESMYIWQEQFCHDSEITLFIKTKTDLFEEISILIKKHHSYEIPEIIQIPITAGSDEYLDWIGNITSYKNYRSSSK